MNKSVFFTLRNFIVRTLIEFLAERFNFVFTLPDKPENQTQRYKLFSAAAAQLKLFSTQNLYLSDQDGTDPVMNIMRAVQSVIMNDYFSLSCLT